MRNKIEVGFAPQSGFSRWMGSVDRVVRLALAFVGSPFKVLLFLGSRVRPVSWFRRIVRTVLSFFYTVGEIGEEIRADTTKVITLPLAYLVGGLLLTARVLWRVRHFPLSRIAAQSIAVVRQPFILVVWIIAVLALAGRSAWMTTSVPYGYLIKAKDAVMPQRSPLGSLSLAPLLGRLRLVGRKLFIFMVRSALVPALGVRSIWMITSLPYTYLLKLLSLVRGDRGLDEAIPSASPIEEPIPPARPVEEPILPVSLVEEPVPPVSFVEESISPVSSIEESIPTASPAEEPIPTMPQVPIQTVDLPRRPLLEVIAAPVAYPAKGLIWSERAVRLAAYTVFTYVFVRPLLAIRFLIPRLLTVLFPLAKVPFLVGRGVGSAAIIPLVLLAFYPWLWSTTPMVTKMQSVRSVGNKVFLLMAFPMVLLSVWIAIVMNYMWSQAIGVPVLLVRRLLLGVSLLRPGSSRTLFSADRDPSPL